MRMKWLLKSAIAGMAAITIASAACGDTVSRNEHDAVQGQLAASQRQTSDLQTRLSTAQQRASQLQEQLAESQQEADGLEGEAEAANRQADVLRRQARQIREIAGPLPASLDRYFPPQAQEPIWLIEMFNLARTFDGIGVNLQENDMQGARTSFDAFKAQWTRMSVMVPEWTSLFPMQPVEDLGAAIDSGDPGKAGEPLADVDRSCRSCHLLNRVKAYQKYHWKDFDSISVTDPVTGRDMKWANYMAAMSRSFSGIAASLRKEELDDASAHFQDFSARYTRLGAEGCGQCHRDAQGNEIPRAYYVDSTSRFRVDQLGLALRGTPDANSAAQLAEAVENEVCVSCHLVHVPAQNRKDQWEAFKDLLNGS